MIAAKPLPAPPSLPRAPALAYAPAMDPAPDDRALMLRSGGKVSAIHVTAPAGLDDGSTVRGDGWTLTLDPGWRLEPADRVGDYRIGPR